MRIGVFSDVHGNWEALELVLRALKEDGADRLFCVGDIVGYGPDPDRCVEKVMESSDVVVAGNHDWAATGQTSTTYFNEYAKIAIEWTRTILSTETEDCLRELPVLCTEGEIALAHSTPDDPEAWNYLFDTFEARRSFNAMTTSICFIGHTHVPVAFIRESEEKISVGSAENVRIEEGKMYIINSGSVGQPRDGDPRAAYGIMDTDDKQFRLKRIPYPVEVVQEKMRRVGLPFYLIHRLSFGM